MNRQLRASSGGPVDTASAVRPTALLSPVSGALFTDSSCASTRRQSADTASPASTTTTSPGTSSRTGSSSRSPSRSTRHVCGTIACSDSAVRSAEYSCAKPMTALSTTTPRMAKASCKVPRSRGCSSSYARKVIPEATISTSANRSVNWAPSCRHTPVRPERGSSLAPYRSSRVPASAADSPRGEVPNVVRTSPAGSPCTAGCVSGPGAAPSGRSTRPPGSATFAPTLIIPARGPGPAGPEAGSTDSVRLR